MQPRFKFVGGTSQSEPIAIRSVPQREHKFVNGISHDKVDAAKTRREVRSHVAKVSANQSNGEGSNSATKGKDRIRNRRTKAIVWPIKLELHAENEQIEITPPRALPGSASPVPAVDSAVAHLPFVPLLLDNYLENLAVAVPELDGPNNTLLLRKSWFPMVIHSPIIFQVIVLFSASHYAAAHKDMTMASDILFLKQIAISGLKDAIVKGQGTFNDEIVGSAAKMAAYEAIFGTEEAYHTHMNGVTDMVQRRGGMQSLGLNGFLARLLQFIDTNSAFLLNCEVHFDESSLPKLANQFLPNPGQFIGAS